MKPSRFMGCFALLLAVASAGCISEGGIRHGWIMRGQVLALEDGVATVCVGSHDGARIGQVLAVHRITVKPGVSSRGSILIKSSDVGQVKIIDLFDEHYARASIVNGTPSVNDIVELDMK